MKNREWIERQSKSPEARKRYEQERLILWATEMIEAAMYDSGLSQTEVATALEVTPAHISQLLSGERNMTLRTLASLAYACGTRVSTVVEPLRAGEFINYPMEMMKTQAQQVRNTQRDERGVTPDHLAA